MDTCHYCSSGCQWPVRPLSCCRHDAKTHCSRWNNRPTPSPIAVSTRCDSYRHFPCNRRSLRYILISTCLRPAGWTTATRSCIYGAPAYVIRRLQAVLNAAARPVTGAECAPLNEHITPILSCYVQLATGRSAHWIQDCADDFQLLPTLYECPAYFHDICRPVACVKRRAMLRSANYGESAEPRTKGKRQGP